MKNILIAINYTPAAQDVAETGFAFGMAMNASVTLLHVTEDPAQYAANLYSPIMGFGGFTDVDFQQPELMANIKSAAVNFLEKTRAHLGNNSVSIMVKEGMVAESVLEAAAMLHAAMIVLGAGNNTWLEETLLGSVTRNLLHHTKIPLLIIPAKK